MSIFLLLILCLPSVPAHTRPSDCTDERSVGANDTLIVHTNETVLSNGRGIHAEVLVYPYQDFKGVNLEVEDENGLPYMAEFPGNITCWQPEKRWWKMKAEVHYDNDNDDDNDDDSSEHAVNFHLSINGCKWTSRREIPEDTSLRKLTIMGQGRSNWTSCADRVTLPSPTSPTSSASSTSPTTPISSPASSPALQPPPPSASPSEEVTVMVVVGWLVAVFVVVVTLVVTVVMVMCWVRRRREEEGGSSAEIRRKSQPHSSSRHDHDGANNNNNNNNNNSSLTPGQRGSAHVSENSIYEPFTGPDTTQ